MTQDEIIEMAKQGHASTRDAIRWAMAQDSKETILYLLGDTPQRTWVGLTDEEVGDLSDFAYANDEEFVRNVEKYLKEKNNG